MTFEQKCSVSQKNSFMTQEEVNSLLISIKESTSSKQWRNNKKIQILSTIPDKVAKNKVKDAWVTQQLKELQSDPLEEQVNDESGKVVASRHWKCNARSCKYQHYKGNCTCLAIKVEAKECVKLTGKKEHACLKHFSVKNEDKNYCHNYFKVHNKLPEEAFLDLKSQTKVPRQTPGISTATFLVPSTSTSSLETQQIEGKITIKICKINIFGN